MTLPDSTLGPEHAGRSTNGANRSANQVRLNSRGPVSGDGDYGRACPGWFCNAVVGRIIQPCSIGVRRQPGLCHGPIARRGSRPLQHLLQRPNLAFASRRHSLAGCVRPGSDAGASVVPDHALRFGWQHQQTGDLADHCWLVRLFKLAMDYRSDTAGCVVAGRFCWACSFSRSAVINSAKGSFSTSCALMTVGIAAHFSHVPIAFGLILLCMGMKPIFAPNQIGIWQWAALLLMPFIVAVCSMLAVTWVDSRGIGFARNSNVFLLAKWVDEGPALTYLTRACPTAGYALCAHVEELKGLTHDDLKWGWNSPFKKVGTFDDLEPEARKIVWATLLAHPFEILQRATVDAGRQLFRFQAGDGLSQDFARLVAGHLAPVFGPGVEKSLIESKQGQGRLPIAEARQLHIAGLIFAAGICFWSIKARRQELPRKLVTLCVFVVLGIIWNAIVTGALSGPYDRYLARVIWLVCFAAFIAFFYVARVRQPGRIPPNSLNHPSGLTVTSARQSRPPS